MIRAFRRQAAACTLAGSLVPTPSGASTAAPARPLQVRVNADAALSAEFTRRVHDYVAVRSKAASGVADLPKEATADQIQRHQRALADAIVRARPRSSAGEIFTKEVRAYLRRQLEGVFGGPEGQKLKAAIMEENPGPIRLRVNGRYPDNVPLASMPAPVLGALPRLPPELEYRFIGDRLVLLDVPADLIVDVIEDALPR